MPSRRTRRAGRYSACSGMENVGVTTRLKVDMQCTRRPKSAAGVWEGAMPMTSTELTVRMFVNIDDI